ncbi:glycyl-radical enzyme activating protein [Vibrio agarivorans]|uniref:glycyl-radical enzyme activating protein n=1 Tax=Vibrio agarivorans TaxID=153622 RepID=UPI0022301958|nr:glycyl-radical enzyme activating protein [Vibrio agarivorans]
MLDSHTQGTVFNIQKFSLHDGPGIRTIVFLKGCYLSCKWCSNPESQKFKPSVFFEKEKCIGCGKCAATCPQQAISLKRQSRIDHQKCVGCGTCTEICPTGALTLSGKTMTVKEVLDEVCKDEVHYRRSSGGLTLSGGEPLAQPDFVEALLKEAKSRGLHTAMETTGIASTDVLNRIIPLLDVVLLDIKTFYRDQHEKYTGLPNDVVLANALTISKLAKQVSVRVPLIPNFNSDEQSVRAIAMFATHMDNVARLHLLPYHNFGQSKYNLLGVDYYCDGLNTPPNKEVNRYKEIVESVGIECVIGG